MAGGELGSKSAKSEPNVVPLCDILLVLLIIFMVVTPMIQKGANVKLPEARNVVEQKESGQIITVSIKRDGTVYVGDKMRADVELEYGKVIDVMNEIKNARIEILALLVDKLTESSD
jgi:biopolymer transport protein ExbD